MRATLVSFVILVLALTGGGVAYLSLRSHHAQLVALQRERSTAAAIEIDAYFEDLLRKMSFLSRVRGLTELPREQQQTLVEALLRHNSAYEAVALVDRSGAILTQATQHAEAKAFTHAAGSPPFVTAYHEGEDYVGPVEGDRELSRHVIDVAVPVRDAGDQIAGALLARIDLEFLMFVVSQVNVGATGYAYVVDNRGYVIAERGAPGDIVRRIAPAVVPITSSVGGRYVGLRGVEVVGAAAPVRSAHWSVVVELPTAEAFQPLRTSAMAVGVALAIGALMALAMGFWFSRQIVQPIEQLTRAAERVQRGELDASVNIEKRNELGLLGRTFNLMTGRMQLLVSNLSEAVVGRDRLLEAERRAREEVERAERRATFLASVGTVLAETLDIGELLARIARLTTPAIADACTIYLIDEDGSVRRAAAVHVDAKREQLMSELCSRYPTQNAAPSPVAETMQRRRSMLITDIAELGADAYPTERGALIRAVDARSAVAVPLAARGRVLGVITLWRCSAEHRYGQADLTLAEDVARRASLALDNAQLYAREQEAVRARDVFLSVASHELRGPITTLRLRLQAALRTAQGERSLDTLAGAVVGAERQASKLAALVAKLLDLSRVAAGRLQLDLEQLDLVEVVREVCQRLEPEAARVGSVLDLRLPKSVIGRWDRLRVEQIVANLVGNALRYAGGQPVEVSLDVERDAARMRIRDYGPGIPHENRSRIFERFERSTNEIRSGGLGLGLYIVRQIVDAHGGSIALESEVGVGSTFTVVLPFRPPVPGDEP